MSATALIQNLRVWATSPWVGFLARSLRAGAALVAVLALAPTVPMWWW